MLTENMRFPEATGAATCGFVAELVSKDVRAHVLYSMLQLDASRKPVYPASDDRYLDHHAEALSTSNLVGHRSHKRRKHSCPPARRGN